ncbi:MAG: hypothetical protein JWN40_167 [Phycisphaerales bacterium]|nr:hypothetical protein [Phycisphaerales bacterium]
MASPLRPNGFIVHIDRQKKQYKLTANGALTVFIFVGAFVAVAIAYVLKH